MNLASILNTPLSQLLGRRKPAPPRLASAPKPRMGATLCCAGLRMTVQAGLTDEMWQWLAALGWRDVPVDNASLGESVKAVEPVVRQVFIGRGAQCPDAEDHVLMPVDGDHRAVHTQRLARDVEAGDWHQPTGVPE